MSFRLPVYRALSPVIVCLLALAVACVPTRDPQTITQLEAARDQVHGLYDTFTGSVVDQDRIDVVRATLAALYAYETSKSDNDLMVKQIEAIQAVFERHIAERTGGQRWSAVNKANKKELIGQAFAIAIATENEKNEE